MGWLLSKKISKLVKNQFLGIGIDSHPNFLALLRKLYLTFSSSCFIIKKANVKTKIMSCSVLKTNAGPDVSGFWIIYFLLSHLEKNTSLLLFPIFSGRHTFWESFVVISIIGFIPTGASFFFNFDKLRYLNV